ncbi:MAG: tellurite resistance TerB family protein [Roseococcus sp.]|nr:tellurite resistance TerB family protein [Roseococcus sp.]
MDFGRIFGAVLHGAAQPPRRRAGPSRRASGPFGLTQTETRQIGRALGALAGIAADALSKSSEAPAPAKPQSAPAPSRPAPPARRLPEVAPKAPPAPPAASAEHAEARLMLRAMIAAARADGVVDRAERTAIAAQLDAAGLSAAERDQVLADFDAPATIEQLSDAARDPILRAQLYAAAFAAAGEISAGERAWLDRLALALKLQPAARKAIEDRLGG